MQEIKVGDYGKAMFDIMLHVHGGYMPDHWASIREEAEPLVRQLLALNDKMCPQGYRITGYVRDGKEVLSEYERIKRARIARWGTTAGDLEKGDRCWLCDYGDGVSIEENDAATVVLITSDYVYLDLTNHTAMKVGRGRQVLKAPPDYDPGGYIGNQYPEAFWIEQADRLGI